MPRPKCDAPAYCLHKRSGRAYVTLSGQQRMLPGPHGSEESRGAYDRLLAEWLAAGRTLADTAATSPTVSTIAAAFWRHAQARYRKPDGTPTSELKNVGEAIRPLRRLYGGTIAREFGPKRLKALRDYVMAPREEDGKAGHKVKRAGWCRTYTNRQVKRLQLMFRWAASEELIPASVPAALGTVSGVRKGTQGVRESEPVRPVADEVVEATIPHLPAPVKALVQLQRLTGARGGELLPMRTCDVDTSGAVWKYRPASHKTAHHGHGRVIRFGPRAQEAIRPFLKPDLQAYIFSPAEAERARRAVAHIARKTPASCGNNVGTNARRTPKRKPGHRYTVESYAHAVYRGCDRAFPLPVRLARRKVKATTPKGKTRLRWERPAEWRQRLGEPAWAEVLAWRGANRWHPHQLRHSAGTVFRRDGDFEAAKILLGHRTDSAAQIYAERDERKADEVMLKIG